MLLIYWCLQVETWTSCCWQTHWRAWGSHCARLDGAPSGARTVANADPRRQNWRVDMPNRMLNL